MSSMRAVVWLGLGVVIAAALARSASADDEVPAAPQGTTASPSSEGQSGDAAPARGFVSTRNIEDKLGEARRERTALFNLGIRDVALRLEKRVYRATRIRFAGIYTLLSQHASDGNGPRNATGGDLDIIGTWDAVQRGGKTVGALDVAFEGRHKAWTSIPPASLSQTIDSLWTTTSGFNVQDFFPIQIYWRQGFLNGRLRGRVGKLSPYSTFFGNRINSSSLFFVNFAFADNPTVFMPANGLGIHVSYDASPRWTFHAGVQNANAIKTQIRPDTLQLDELWYAVQVDFHAKLRGLGEGTYRLGAWYVNARDLQGQNEGEGAVLSIDQELGKKLLVFLRAEWQGRDLLNPEVQFDALTATRSCVRGGFGLPGPFRRLPDDYMGLGLAWGDPAKSTGLLKDSWVGEFFYRSQMTNTTQLSLSIQAIRSSTVFQQVLVFSARFRFEF